MGDEREETPEQIAGDLVARAHSYFEDMRRVGSAERTKLWRELQSEFVTALSAAERRGAETEREACAEVAEREGSINRVLDPSHIAHDTAISIAAKIRARSEGGLSND